MRGFNYLYKMKKIINYISLSIIFLFYIISRIRRLPLIHQHIPSFKEWYKSDRLMALDVWINLFLMVFSVLIWFISKLI